MNNWTLQCGWQKMAAVSPTSLCILHFLFLVYHVVSPLSFPFSLPCRYVFKTSASNKPSLLVSVVFVSKFTSCFRAVSKRSTCTNQPTFEVPVMVVVPGGLTGRICRVLGLIKSPFHGLPEDWYNKKAHTPTATRNVFEKMSIGCIQTNLKLMSSKRFMEILFSWICQYLCKNV